MIPRRDPVRGDDFGPLAREDGSSFEHLSVRGTRTYWDWDAHVAALMAEKALAPTRLAAAFLIHEAHERESYFSARSSTSSFPSHDADTNLTIHSAFSTESKIHAGLELRDRSSSPSSKST